MGLPIGDEVGLEPVRRGVAAGPGADGVGLVDDEQRARLRGGGAQRVVEPRLGQDDADVGEGRLGQHAGHVARRQRGAQRLDVVERHHPRGQCRVDLRPEAAGSGHHRAVGPEDHERLVDGAVVAPVEHGHLRPAREVAGEAQHEAVGVGGAERELPRRQPEAPGQVAGHPGGVGRGEHGGDAVGGLACHGLGDERPGVAAHRPGVAEREVDVLDPVGVGDAGAVGLGGHHGEGTRPAGHPRHRHPAQQPGPGLGRELGRPGVQLHEAGPLAGEQLVEPVPVDHLVPQL